ncbi:hypothetical protein RhiirC2_329674 [Rhizophagus irregularis]|uniref:Uncharacterized protein n=1 Tax=Rhizophagus irregularis TaxID=588596 RepID=A0A2N1NIH1_9GLOM|nr:hypothetical protein RhiirC2_329674 [Rhizophagus irregularis]
MRNYIEEEQEKKKATSNEPTKIINSVMNNIQRIRGESTPVSNPNSPTLSSTSSKSPSPLSSPKPSPVLSTSKSKELLKANNNFSKAQNDINPSLRPRVVTPQTRGNLIPANKVNNQKNLVSNNDPHPPRPTAPSPAAMNRDENINGGFNRTEMLDRHAEMTRDRYFETDDNNSDDQADSESDDRTESESEDDDASSVSPSGVNTEVEEDDDDEESFDKWSTHASSKHDLDSIVEEEDEDDDDDEFEFDEVQQMARQKNRAPFNPSSPIKNSSQNFMAKNDQYKKIVNNVQSVYTSSLSQQLSGNNNKSSTQNQKRIHQDYGYPHRDSMSSIKSDSSDDSTLSVLSSQNGSYPSSVTSPSSFGSNNDLYGQSSADSSSNKPNTNLYNSKFDKNGLNDNYPTSVSTSQHADHHYNNSLNCQQPNNNKYNNSLNSTTN